MVGMNTDVAYKCPLLDRVLRGGERTYREVRTQERHSTDKQARGSRDGVIKIVKMS
jgi:hypothetical protein